MFGMPLAFEGGYEKRVVRRHLGLRRYGSVAHFGVLRSGSCACQRCSDVIEPGTDVLVARAIVETSDR